MCGIAGFLGWCAPDESALNMRRMTDAIRHRGPDDEGLWIDQEAGVALGHRRLSILDLSQEGHQPMHSRDGRFTIVFNGEIYNYLDLRTELEQAGFSWRGHSDTEVMLAAFSHWGIQAATAKFNGMFAFALWDARERLLWLARDRFGKKPLYYGWNGRTFLFGSELKALRAHPAFSAELDPNALALYFRHGYIPAPWSIYKEIRKLPAAALAAVRPEPGAPIEPVPYWSARSAIEEGLAHPFAGTPEDALAQLRSLLESAVGLRMISDVPLGAFLSGGVDSSLVVALMQSLHPRPVKTFSIGFLEQGFNEAAHAKAVAVHLATEHTELFVKPADAQAVIPCLPFMYDEPFADSSQIPTFLVSKLARTAVTVALSGDGGDEFFAGYNAYRLNARALERWRWYPRFAGRLLRAVPRATWDLLLPRSDAGHRAHRLGSALSESTPEMVYRDLISHQVCPRDLLPDAMEPSTAFSAERINVPSDVQRMQYLDTRVYLPDDILVKVDRASMAVSLEARCPLLDYRLFEFAWRLPLEWKLKGNTGKWLVRELLYRYVPRELVERPKTGFGVPIGEWIGGPLRPWAESLLADLKRGGLIRFEAVRRLWEEHLAGRPHREEMLWGLLSFQAWQNEQKGTR